MTEMKLQRTDKVLTEADAIELLEAAFDRPVNHTISEDNKYFSFYSQIGINLKQFYLEKDTLRIGAFKSAPLDGTGQIMANTLGLTNKAIALGYYKIEEQ